MIILIVLSTLCYIISTFIVANNIFNRHPQFYKLMYISWVGLLSHASLLAQQILLDNQIDMGVFNALSLTSMIMLCIILPDLKRHLDIALIILPISAATICLSNFFQTHNIVSNTQSISLGIHIASSMAAYAILALAAIQAFFLYLRDKVLKHQKYLTLALIFKKLPPLMRMEYFLFKLLFIGYILLSISLFAGIQFFELWFTKPLIHKTILSLTAWVIFSGLLALHYFFGLRGRSAVKWTLLAFIILIFGFTGTRLVQEFLLHRAY